MNSTNTSWQSWLTTQLAELLQDPTLAADLVQDPAMDLVEAGLDSLRTFRLLDELADLGVDVEATEFFGSANTSYLLEVIEASGASAPSL